MSITKKTRFEVFKRDKFKCQYCGKSSPDVILEVDHINPKSNGGKDDLLNLVTSCFECNRGKGKRKLSDDTQVKKQKTELQVLMAKNEQLEMLIKYRDECQNIIEKEIDYIQSIFQEEFTENTFTEVGRKKVKRWINKYTLNEVTEAMEIAINQYSDPDVLFSKMSGILRNRQLFRESPEIQSFYHFRNILKNRLAYINDYKILPMIKSMFYKHDIQLDEIKEIVLTVKNWTEFESEYIDRTGEC